MNNINEIYQKNVFSKFSKEEFEFILKYQNSSDSNYAPNEQNIYGTLNGIQTPSSGNNRQFKLVIPTVVGGKIDGYQSTALLKSLEGGNITEKTTKDVISMAERGEIAIREAMFIIRARHDIIDAPYSRGVEYPEYGTGGRQKNDYTGFHTQGMRDIAFNQDMARKVVNAMDNYENRIKELDKKGYIKLTFGNTGTAQRLFYDENEIDRRLRWKILDPGISKFLSHSNPDTERAVLNETLVFIGCKNSRDQKDFTIRADGPKPNIFKYVKTNKNKNGTLSIDELSLNNSADVNMERELSVETFAFVMDQIQTKLYKWTLAIDTGVPKDLTIATAMVKELLNHSGSAYQILDKFVKYGDKSIVAYKSIKAFIKMLDKADQQILERNPQLITDIINGPIKPWLFMYMGAALKKKLTAFVLERFGTKALIGKIFVPPVATGILIVIDLATIVYDVATEYRENAEKLEKLIKEANELGFLPGPYVQTNGKVQIPVLKVKTGELRKSDGTIIDSFDYSVPIGVERDAQGNVLPLLRKDIYQNDILPNSPIPYIDPKTKLPIPGVYVPKFIYPKTGNLPFHVFLQRIGDDQYGQNLAGLYLLDENNGIPSWEDVAEDVVQYYVGRNYESEKAKSRSQLLVNSISENNSNGFSGAFSSAEQNIIIPPSPAVAVEGPEFRDDLPFLQKVDDLSNLLGINSETSLRLILGFSNYTADLGKTSGFLETVPESDISYPPVGLPLNSSDEIINPVAGYSG